MLRTEFTPLLAVTVSLLSGLIGIVWTLIMVHLRRPRPRRAAARRHAAGRPAARPVSPAPSTPETAAAPPAPAARPVSTTPPAGLTWPPHSESETTR